jgi:hypothetical protein
MSKPTGLSIAQNLVGFVDLCWDKMAFSHNGRILLKASSAFGALFLSGWNLMAS